ncbi:MAG: hypothetical protein HUJ70_06450 [Pseudobutyrivibrio sp.]|nr:hypothetical protein [Pseudobutyrivibrio sp.]
MTWIDNFYLSDNISSDRSAVKRKIRWNKDLLEYYLLTVSSMKDGMIDIIPALELNAMPKRVKDDMVVVGVSSGYNNARQLVAKMAEDIYTISGNYDMKTFFVSQARG